VEEEEEEDEEEGAVVAAAWCEKVEVAGRDIGGGIGDREAVESGAGGGEGVEETAGGVAVGLSEDWVQLRKMPQEKRVALRGGGFSFGCGCACWLRFMSELIRVRSTEAECELSSSINQLKCLCGGGNWKDGDLVCDWDLGVLEGVRGVEK
jgi:hypothetical protein